MQIRNVIKLPVVLVALFILAMFILDSMSSGYSFALPQALFLSVVTFAVGVLIIVLGGFSFKKVNTTVNPMRPEQATRLVTTGIYRVSRNPMYIGFLMWLIAGVIIIGNIINIFLLPVFVVLANKLYIYPEEVALEKLFHDEYAEYKKRVRRWI